MSHPSHRARAHTGARAGPTFTHRLPHLMFGYVSPVLFPCAARVHCRVAPGRRTL